MRKVQLSVIACLLLAGQAVSARPLVGSHSPTASHSDKLEFALSGAAARTTGVFFASATTGAGIVQINSLATDKGRGTAETNQTIVSTTDHEPSPQLSAKGPGELGQTDAADGTHSANLGGDLDLNGTAFEEADLQLYIDYFTRGVSVFAGHFAASETESETNGDGRTLTVSDMVYMIRTTRGDALPLSELTHERDTVTLTQRGDDIHSDLKLGALYLVFEGITTVELEDECHGHGHEHGHGHGHGHGDGDEHGHGHGQGHSHGHGHHHGHGHGDNNGGDIGSGVFLASFHDDDGDDHDDGHEHDDDDHESHHSQMTLEVGIVDGNTHVLIYDIGDNQLCAGEILDDVNARLLFADASDFNGSFVVVRFDFPTDVNDDVALQPTAFDLHQNYPNPFNPTTTIQFSLPKRSEVELVVYNMLGQRIRTLLSQSAPAGEYNVVWDGADKSGRSVASGMYFYRLKVGDVVSETRKMVLLK